MASYSTRNNCVLNNGVCCLDPAGDKALAPSSMHTVQDIVLKPYAILKKDTWA